MPYDRSDVSEIYVLVLGGILRLFFIIDNNTRFYWCDAKY